MGEGETQHFTATSQTMVTFTAEADDSFGFIGWSGTGQSGTTTPLELRVGGGIGSASDPLTANFKPLFMDTMMIVSCSPTTVDKAGSMQITITALLTSDPFMGDSEAVADKPVTLTYSTDDAQTGS